MKNILVPTDFSDCANDAVEAAIELAKKNEATVYLLTVYDLLPNKALKDKKKFALAQLSKKYLNDGIRIKTAYVEGKFISSINDFAKANNVDLIIMGSHGASGMNEIIIGSNTQKVVRSIHFPILVVKNKLETVDFKNIIFASDFSLKEQIVFEHFLEFIKQFSNPHIHLVAVNTSSFFNQPEFILRDSMKKFKNMAGEIPCSTNIQYNFNVEAGIKFFSETIDADLIVVSNYQKSMLRKLFVGSTVEALINHSEIPILSLDFE